MRICPPVFLSITRAGHGRTVISTMKVLELVSMLSDIPMRVNRRSTGRRAANSAGTKQPTCGVNYASVMCSSGAKKHEQQRQSSADARQARLCHDNEQCHLAQVGGFAGHIGTGEYGEAGAVWLTFILSEHAEQSRKMPSQAFLLCICTAEVGVIGYELSARLRLLQQRVTARHNGQGAMLAHARAHIPGRQAPRACEAATHRRACKGMHQTTYLPSAPSTAAAKACSMSSSAMLSMSLCSMSMCRTAPATAPSRTCFMRSHIVPVTFAAPHMGTWFADVH